MRLTFLCSTLPLLGILAEGMILKRDLCTEPSEGSECLVDTNFDRGQAQDAIACNPVLVGLRMRGTWFITKCDWGCRSDPDGIRGS
jgi:hypothetical protein